jgi:hypothetical protein
MVHILDTLHNFTSIENKNGREIQRHVIEIMIMARIKKT